MSTFASSEEWLRGVIDAQREIVAAGGWDLSRIMNVVVERAQRLSGASAAAVELREGEEMVYRAASGSAAAALGLRLKLGESLSGLCVRTGQALICKDAEDDVRVDRQACRRIGVRSMLVVPLRTAAEVVGVLKVMSAQPAQFDEQIAERLTLMAGLVAESMALARAREEAARAAALFESAFANASIGIALVSLEGRFLRVNDSLCRILGYARDELLATDFQAITHPEDVRLDGEQLRHMVAGEARTYEREKRYLHKSGEVVWAHLTSAIVFDAAHKPAYLVAQMQDVTRRKLAESESRAFFELSPDLLAIAGPDDRLGEVNDAWTLALGYSKEELTSRPYLEFVHPDDRERTLAESQRLRREPPSANFRNRYVKRDGTYRWFEWTTKKSLHGRYYAIGRDVTDQVERESALAELAALDALTGLPNRRIFDLTLERACAEDTGDALALMMLDIDHFKAINDEHGHAAGDEVLRRFAEVLRASLRGADISARWGGEEFVVLLRGSSRADLSAIADRIRRTCAQTEMVPSDPTWRVTVSVGVAERRPNEPIALWQGRADAAMYAAKRAGRNRVSID